MDISVIVPSYESDQTIARCLQALIDQHTMFTYDVTVVDSSPHDRVEKITAKFSTMKFIKLREKTYPGIARNIGAEESRGGLLVFVDADVVISPDWIEKAMLYYKEGHDIFIGSIGLFCRKKGSIMDKLQVFYEFSEFKPSMKESHRWCLPSYALGIKRQIFEGEPFSGFRYSQDTELTVRLRAKGNVLYFNPGLKVLHINRSIFSQLVRKAFWHGVYNMKVRKIHNVSGSAFIKIRPLALFVIPLFALIKFAKISWRNLRYNGCRDTILYIILTPYVSCLVASWMSGCYYELLSDKPRR